MPHFFLPLVLILLLLSVVIAKISFSFKSTYEFYNDLGEGAMQFLFQIIPLSAKTIEMLGQLLADGRVGIQEAYNTACKLTSYSRAITLLTLMHNRKDLEMQLLGPACLSPAIIAARRSIPHMWPPSGFPLIAKNLTLTDINLNDATEFIEEALNQPEWWQSSDWTWGIDLSKMKIFRFWRMIPPSLNYGWDGVYYYLIKDIRKVADKPTCHDLEELLMKSIRILGFSTIWRQMLSNDLDMHAVLRNFSHLQGSWSSKALKLLEKIYSKNPKRPHPHNVILESGLLQFASWKGSLIDPKIITNDILELFGLAIVSAAECMRTGEIIPSLETFLNQIPDWSVVCPLAISRIVEGLELTAGRSFLTRYVDRMLKNTLTIRILPSWLLQSSTNLQVCMYNLKLHSVPLRSRLASSNRYPNNGHLDSYILLFYEEWRQDKINWPSIIAFHEQMKNRIREVFRPSENQDGTWDPKTDQEYSDYAWSLAFSSIKFEIDHGIPSITLPSVCFLQALLHYHKVSNMEKEIKWSILKKEVVEECLLPKIEEQARYLSALKWANFHLFNTISLLPTTNPKLLQDLIRGNDNDVTEIALTRLGKKVERCALQ